MKNDMKVEYDERGERVREIHITALSKQASIELKDKLPRLLALLERAAPSSLGTEKK